MQNSSDKAATLSEIIMFYAGTPGVPITVEETIG